MLYLDSEIDAFAKVFFKETKNQGSIDLAKLNGFIDPAVDRYNDLTEEQDKMDFRAHSRRLSACTRSSRT